MRHAASPPGTEIRTFSGEHDGLGRIGQVAQSLQHHFCHGRVKRIAVLGRHQRHVENIVSGEFYGNLFVADVTLWFSTAGGIDSLRQLWTNVVERPSRS